MTAILSEVTVGRARAELVALCRAHPDRVNPKVNGRCVYTHLGDPDSHCLIGQWLVDRGVTLPTVDSGANGAWFLRLVDHGYADALTLPGDVVRFLDRVQGYADAGGTRWGRLADMIETAV